MPVKIRLQRKGRKQRPFYHIVVADARSPRDGRFIERLGTYNPMTKPATIDIDRQRAYEWLTQGAQPTDTVRAILRFKGVFYRKHLMRGVTKGALTQEEADKKWEEWIEAKEAKIASRREATAAEHEEARLAMLGTAPVIEEPVVEEAPAEEAEAPAEEAEAATEAEAPAEAEASAEAEAPAEEAPAAEETPAEEEKKDEA
jgi:small subunit ribosomal protein S16